MNQSSLEQLANQDENPVQEAFVEEVKRMKKEELDPNSKTVHFVFTEKDMDLFHPEALTEADRIIWEKVKEGTVTREDIIAYRKELPSLDESAFFEQVQKGGTMHDAMANIDVNKRSRLIFGAFIANKATPVIGEQEEKDFAGRRSAAS